MGLQLNKMEVSFVLNQRSRAKTSIRAQFTIAGTKFTYPTGISILTSEFSNGKTKNKAYNLKLQAIKAAIINTNNYFERKFMVPSQKEFREKIVFFLNGDNMLDIANRDKNFFDFFDKYIKECDKSSYTKRSYITTKNKLLAFFGNRKVYFQDINLEFEAKLKKWMKNNNDSRNYIATVIKNIYTLMNIARKTYKLHDNLDYENFIKDEETADTIFLSIEELYKIHNLKITIDDVKGLYDKKPNEYYNPKTYQRNIENSVKSLNLAKNKFLIGAVCAMRISDYNRIKSHNIKDGIITIMPKKGNSIRKPEPATILMHPIMRDIIESGFDIMQPMAEQKLNKQIKIVGKLAGITEIASRFITKGGVLREKRVPKCELISSHTARRSGATNMALSGMDRDTIKICTGHASIAQLEKYIKTTLAQIGDVSILKKCSYFKDLNTGEENEEVLIQNYLSSVIRSGSNPIWLELLKREMNGGDIK